MKARAIPLRRFTKSKKAWEISLDGATVHTRDGGGATKEKQHASFEQAIEDWVIRVSAKLWEGWIEEIAPGRAPQALPVLEPADLRAQRARLGSLLEEAKLSHRAAAVQAATKPAIRLRFQRREENDFEIGASRFGGHPDLPARTPWPVHVDAKTRKKPERVRPLDFVGQLRLEDIAPLDEAKLLPKSGLLSFFVLGDYDTESAHEPDYLSVCRVLYSSTQLDRKPLPADYARTWGGKRVALPFVAHSVEAFPILTLAPPDNRASKKLRLSDDERERFYEASTSFEQWRRRLFPGARGTHVLGYRNRMDDREPKEVLLLQCETDYSTQMTWGDAELLYFWIRPRALQKGRFDDVTSNYAD